MKEEKKEKGENEKKGKEGSAVSAFLKKDSPQRVGNNIPTSIFFLFFF